MNLSELVTTPRRKLVWAIYTIAFRFLVAGITPQNRHGEQDWGKRVGNEVW